MNVALRFQHKRPHVPSVVTTLALLHHCNRCKQFKQFKYLYHPLRLHPLAPCVLVLSSPSATASSIRPVKVGSASLIRQKTLTITAGQSLLSKLPLPSSPHTTSPSPRILLTPTLAIY